MSTSHERLGASQCDDGVALKAIEPLRGEIWRTTMPRQIRPTRCRALLHDKEALTHGAPRKRVSRAAI
jgi:hypothetical protein